MSYYQGTPKNAWTQEERDFLTKHYLTMTDAEMAAKLDRMLSGVKVKRNALGLYRIKPWTKEEEQMALALGETLSAREVSVILERSFSSAKEKLTRLRAAASRAS